MRIETGSRWQDSLEGVAEIYAASSTAVSVALPDGTTSNVTTNIYGRASINYTLPQNSLTGQSFRLVASVGGIIDSDTVAYMPADTTVAELYFVHAGNKTRLVENGRYIPANYYTYVANGEEKNKYWSFYAELQGSDTLDEVQMILTMLDGSTKTVTLTQKSKRAVSGGWKYVYVGEIRIEQAGNHVFNSALIPVGFALKYDYELLDLNVGAILQQAQDEAEQTQILIYGSNPAASGAPDNQTLGELFGGEYIVSGEPWFGELTPAQQQDVTAGQDAINSAVGDICGALGTTADTMRGYCTPSDDSGSTPAGFDRDAFFRDNGITAEPTNGFSPDSLSGQGYNVYGTDGSRIAVKEGDNGIKCVSEEGGYELDIDYTEAAQGNATFAAASQTVSAAGDAAEKAADALTFLNPKAAARFGRLSKMLGGLGTAMGLLDAYNNSNDLAEMYEDMEWLRGDIANSQMWLDRYKSYGVDSDCIKSLTREIEITTALLNLLEKNIEQAEGNILVGAVFTVAGVATGGTGAAVAGGLSLLWDTSSNLSALERASRIEKFKQEVNLAVAAADSDCDDADDTIKRKLEAGFRATPLLDPSGIVYEALESSTLSGVTATIYVADDAQGTNARVWAASGYDQTNPQTTGADGAYAWDVLSGWWQVRFTKAGYTEAQTEWMQVPPPRMNLTTAMVSTDAPTVATANAYPDYIEVIFSQYMDKTASLTLSTGMTGTWQGSETYSKVLHVTKTGGFTLDEPVTLTISGAKNYAGRALAAYNSGALTVSARPAEIVLNYVTTIAMKAGETPTVTVRVKDSDGNYMPGVTVEAAVANPLLSTIAANAATDADGKSRPRSWSLSPAATRTRGASRRSMTRCRDCNPPSTSYGQAAAGKKSCSTVCTA